MSPGFRSDFPMTDIRHCSRALHGLRCRFLDIRPALAPFRGGPWSFGLGLEAFGIRLFRHGFEAMKIIRTPKTAKIISDQ